MLFSTELTRAIVAEVWMAGDVPFFPGEPTEDLDAVLDDCGITAALSPRERACLVRQLEQIAETYREVVGPGDSLADSDVWAAFRSEVTLDDVLQEMEDIIPPMHPDYMVDDEDDEWEPHGPGPDSPRYAQRDPYRCLGDRPQPEPGQYDLPGLFDDYEP